MDPVNLAPLFTSLRGSITWSGSTCGVGLVKSKVYEWISVLPTLETIVASQPARQVLRSSSYSFPWIVWGPGRCDDYGRNYVICTLAPHAYKRASFFPRFFSCRSGQDSFFSLFSFASTSWWWFWFIPEAKSGRKCVCQPSFSPFFRKLHTNPPNGETQLFRAAAHNSAGTGTDSVLLYYPQLHVEALIPPSGEDLEMRRKIINMSVYLLIQFYCLKLGVLSFTSVIERKHVVLTWKGWGDGRWLEKDWGLVVKWSFSMRLWALWRKGFWVGTWWWAEILFKIKLFCEMTTSWTNFVNSVYSSINMIWNTI